MGKHTRDLHEEEIEVPPPEVQINMGPNGIIHEFNMGQGVPTIGPIRANIDESNRGQAAVASTEGQNDFRQVPYKIQHGSNIGRTCS
ncbi:hypothetical protein DPMN_056365 [Dreissena polymorpha]|uniref:Uncharacterized protein n=1 Tax=Dreissena polymorpha TaxID=45954 RepID=A0A9D4CT41_DREPO|nr:hypothetical protein DPMN_056365 [Dreissena polymorpha]